jgi:hypothetical protein
MESVETRLTRIESDGKETREGVGKILRAMLEGNGQPSFTSRLQAVEGSLSTVEDCLREQKEAEKGRIQQGLESERQRKQTRFALWLAVGGWIVTIIGVVTKWITF